MKRASWLYVCIPIQQKKIKTFNLWLYLQEDEEEIEDICAKEYQIF